MSCSNLVCKHPSDIGKCELQGSEKVSLTCVQGDKAPRGMLIHIKDRRPPKNLLVKIIGEL